MVVGSTDSPQEDTPSYRDARMNLKTSIIAPTFPNRDPSFTRKACLTGQNKTAMPLDERNVRGLFLVVGIIIFVSFLVSVTKWVAKKLKKKQRTGQIYSRNLEVPM